MDLMLGIFWATYILYKRFALIKAETKRKLLAFPFATMLIVFYFGVNQYRSYVLDTYGRASGGMHGMHGMGRAGFQRVSPDKAIILQKGKDKSSCRVCGMKLPMFFKTNHSAKIDSKVEQYCSIHCLAKRKLIEHKDLKDILVVDTNHLKFIDATKASLIRSR